MSQQAGMLRSQIMTSAKLSAITFASNVGLRLVSTLVLTRLLAPEIYGVFAVVLVYLYLLELLSDLGLRSLVLTREGDVSDSFLSTCWTVSILRGAVIFLLSCMIGGVVAAFQAFEMFAPDNPYAADVLPWAFVVLGISALIFGLESPMRFMHERDMRFGRVTATVLIRNIVTLIVTISLAYWLKSVWALVLGQIVRSSLHAALSHIAFPGLRRSLHLDRTDLKVLIERGKWILGQSVLTALSNSSDRILLGFVMNSATFGFYYIARQLIDLVPLFLTKMNGQMGLQVFSRLHEKGVAEFRRNFYRYRLIFDALSGVCAGGIVVLAPLIVEILFDDRYTGVGPIMQILGLGILLIGPVIWRDVFNAERRFKIGTLAGLAGVVALWLGMGVAIFVFDNVTLALVVVALYRLPEALILIGVGRIQGWVSLRREGFGLLFFAVGAAVGWSVLQLWRWGA